jgi:APA family basic amino acid/polyamine antiporter
MFGLSKITWFRFFIWLFIGILIYFFYGVKHSNIRREVKNV